MHKLVPKWRLILFFPVISLFLVVAIIYFYGYLADMKQGSPFAHPAGSDVIGIYSKKPLHLAIQYNIDWREVTPLETFQPEGRLSIKVFGPASGEMKVLIPLESTVLAKNVKQEGTFESLHAFTTTLALGSQESKTLNFRYRLPARQSPYLLRLIPSAGKMDYKITSAFPDYLDLAGTNMNISGSVAAFEGSLARSRTLHIDFHPTASPMLLSEGKINNLKTIELKFKRSVTQSSAQDGLNFALTDINEKNAEITDRLFITDVQVRDKSVFLTVKGMTLQRGESYELKIQNLKDRVRNLLSPNPLVLELIQPTT